MDFEPSKTTTDLQARVRAFLDEEVLPAEARFAEEVGSASSPWSHPTLIEELKAKARERSLWNLFVRDEAWGEGLTNLEYAPLAEIMGWSPSLAPEAMNCAAPDTGNMELLMAYAAPEIQQRWLVPLLAGEIRSAFSMTEPEVASSDATNLMTRIERDGDDYVITGRKWWSSGAMRDRCEVAIVMGVSDPDASKHRRQSMIVVPLDTPGVDIRRSTSVFGYSDGPHGGHAEIVYDNVRVPRENMLGELGDGFAIAQARLGPGRIHHCMRALGMAERAVDLMARRVQSRETFGVRIADHGLVQDWLAESRIEIEQARLLVLKTAWMMDKVGNKEAKAEIAAIKVSVPRMAVGVVDRAIQAFGGGGVSQDFPLAEFWAHLRILRIADGPDEVHKRALARWELQRHPVSLEDGPS